MVNFLKASKYLSVGKWEICDCISVVSKDEIWKHFSPKKELSLFSEVFLVFITWYSSVNTHTLLLYFSMTQLAVKKNQHLSDTQRRGFFGRVGFSVYILTFCYCSAHVTKIVEVRASWPLSHFCLHLSFSFLASPAWWNLRPRRTGTGSRSPPLQTQCGVPVIPIIPLSLMLACTQPGHIRQNWALTLPTHCDYSVDLLGFPQFPPPSSFCPRTPPRVPHCFWLSCLQGPLCSMTVSQSCLICHAPDAFEEDRSGISWTFLQFGFVWCLLVRKRGFWAKEEFQGRQVCLVRPVTCHWQGDKWFWVIGVRPVALLCSAVLADHVSWDDHSISLGEGPSCSPSQILLVSRWRQLGLGRASDLCIRLGLAGGPGALPALASFCGLGHSQDSARTELFLGAEWTQTHWQKWFLLGEARVLRECLKVAVCDLISAPVLCAQSLRAFFAGKKLVLYHLGSESRWLAVICSLALFLPMKLECCYCLKILSRDWPVGC